jgi:hypothetical protein
LGKHFLSFKSSISPLEQEGLREDIMKSKILPGYEEEYDMAVAGFYAPEIYYSSKSALHGVRCDTRIDLGIQTLLSLRPE